MATTTKQKQDLFIEALTSSAGNISVACKKVGISRETYYKWYKNPKYKSFKKSVDEVNEGLVDLAETMLFKNIKDGKTAEIIFFLKTKGRERGYVERVEIDNLPKSDIDKLSDEELEAEIQKELKRRAKKNG